MHFLFYFAERHSQLAVIQLNRILPLPDTECPRQTNRSNPQCDLLQFDFKMQLHHTGRLHGKGL